MQSKRRLIVSDEERTVPLKVAVRLRALMPLRDKTEARLRKTVGPTGSLVLRA
jgi:hypothetical protein